MHQKKYLRKTEINRYPEIKKMFKIPRIARTVANLREK